VGSLTYPLWCQQWLPCLQALLLEIGICWTNGARITSTTYISPLSPCARSVATAAAAPGSALSTPRPSATAPPMRCVRVLTLRLFALRLSIAAHGDSGGCCCCSCSLPAKRERKGEALGKRNKARRKAGATRNRQPAIRALFSPSLPPVRLQEPTHSSPRVQPQQGKRPKPTGQRRGTTTAAAGEEADTHAPHTIRPFASSFSLSSFVPSPALAPACCVFPFGSLAVLRFVCPPTKTRGHAQPPAGLTFAHSPATTTKDPSKRKAGRARTA